VAGTSIEETTDGGRAGRRSCASQRHLGMDLVSRDVGFAVGVTSLRITSDGGKHWRQVPSRLAIHWYGSSSTRASSATAHHDGTLVRSVDGGHRGAPPGRPQLPPPRASPRSGRLRGRPLGDLYATHDGGDRGRVERAPSVRNSSLSLERPVVQRHEHLARPAADLCCRLCCNQPVPRYTQRDGGSSWSTIASDWPTASPTTAPVAYLAAVAAGGRTAGGRGPSDRRFITAAKLRLMADQGPDGTYTTATIPALPHRPRPPWNCISARDLRRVTGWLYIDDTGVGSRRNL